MVLPERNRRLLHPRGPGFHNTQGPALGALDAEPDRIPGSTQRNPGRLFQSRDSIFSRGSSVFLPRNVGSLGLRDYILGHDPLLRSKVKDAVQLERQFD